MVVGGRQLTKGLFAGIYIQCLDLHRKHVCQPQPLMGVRGVNLQNKILPGNCMKWQTLCRELMFAGTLQSPDVSRGFVKCQSFVKLHKDLVL